MVIDITLITTYKYYADHNIRLVSSHPYFSTFMLIYLSPFVLKPPPFCGGLLSRILRPLSG
jgi:hypothetical protein